MSKFTISIFIFLLSVLLASISQIILKKSAKKNYKSHLTSLVNNQTIIAYAVFFLSFVLTMIAYKKVPLSLGMVIEASSYFYILVFGYWFFGEKISKKKLLGNVLIIIGIIIFSFSTK
ncbi:MAG: multidrug transporter [Bacillales bacterium]|jgi:drug/metabolite transporter (DMT)-like permease|nr:multidrug transporter [Bacillales bacterium]